MSFCRITGKARGLPKPNYFPLLPPISPADAKRFCRITTKSQGLPGHHFVPALLGARGSRTHCRVTGKSEGQAPHHFPNVENTLKPHDFIPGYKYVFPKFDEEEKLQQKVLQLMYSKTLPGESNARFVYPVEERLTGLVIPAALEAAVRDGDIRDLMLDKDMMLVKLHQGPSVTINVTDLVMEEGMVLWDGLGPSQAVLKLRQKEEKEMELRRKKRQEGLLKRKQIFEDKEKAADDEEMELAKIRDTRKSRVVKVKMRGGSDDLDVIVDSGPMRPEYLSDSNDQPVFGHIVQTTTAVEFFPGETILNLPEGKVVPGRLVRNSDGVKFVPGIMSDGRFIPGQVVSTNSGDHFVPGQVIDTRDGPKFVPGQVAETASGPKFVPGQTIETEDGPQFVPGQIIETKAGPTFIPGQIIVTDDQPRFVPGRVVETAEGPRFVPGRVIESGNQVTFVSGQVVETSEGLKFVAPDLEYMPEGGHEFSVQGFEVTPEELKLLRPAAICHPASSGSFTINSKMLRQLSEAGLSVGRQVPTKLPEVVIRPLPLVVEKLKLNGAQALKMSHVISVLSKVAMKISERTDLCASNIQLEDDIGDKLLCAVKNKQDLGKYLKTIVASSVVAARNNQDEETLLATLGLALENALSAHYESNLTKESILTVIHSVIEDQLPPEMVEERLLDIESVINQELKTKLESAITKESILKVLNVVLDDKLSDENSSKTKTFLKEAMQLAIEREQFATCINQDTFLTVLSSAVHPELLSNVSNLLTKESLISAICSELEAKRKTNYEWNFDEENIFSVIKSAVEKEISCKGITVKNGSLPAAIMASLKEGYSSSTLSEEKAMTCLASILENDLLNENGGTLIKEEILMAMNCAISEEKSQKMMSEEVLLSATYAALEKIAKKMPDEKAFLNVAVEKIKKDVSLKHENADKNRLIAKSLEKAIEEKVTAACENVLNMEMAMAAVDAVIDNDFVKAKGTMLREEILRVITSTFQENSQSVSSVVKKEKLLAALQKAFEEKYEIGNSEKMLKAFNLAIDQKLRAKYESTLPDDVVMSAVESAIETVVSQGDELNISKAAMISIAKAELKNIKFAATEKLTERKIIEAVRSAVLEKLELNEEKASVNESFSKAFEAALREERQVATLSDHAVMSAVEAALKAVIFSGEKIQVSKAALLSVAATKMKNVKSVVPEKIMEGKIIDAVCSSILNELSLNGEKSSVLESVSKALESAICEERKATTLSDQAVMSAIESAMKSVICTTGKINVTKATLLNIAAAEVKKVRSEIPKEITEDRIISSVGSAILNKLSSEGENANVQKCFSKAFELAIRKEWKKGNLNDEVFKAAVETALKAVVSSGEKLSVSNSSILSIATAELQKVRSVVPEKIMEGKIITAVYSAILDELSLKGEDATVQQSFLDAFKSAITEERMAMPLNDQALKSAIESAIRSVDTSAEKLKVSKSHLLSIAATEIDNTKAILPEKIMEHEIISAVRSAVLEELLLNGEKDSVHDFFSKAFDSAIHNERMETVLSEQAIKSAVESAVKVVSSGEKLNLPKEAILSAAVEEMNKMKSVLPKKITEGKIIEAVRSAILEKFELNGEKASVHESFSKAFEAALGEERQVATLSDQAVMSAVESAMQAVISSGEKINVSKALLLNIASAEMEKAKSGVPERITSDKILDAVSTAILKTFSSKGEKDSVQKSFAKAFASAINDVKQATILNEQAVMSAVTSAIKTVESCGVKLNLSKSALLSIADREINKVKTISPEEITEGRIIAAVHSAILKELSSKCDKDSVGKAFSKAFELAINRERKVIALDNQVVMSAAESAAEAVALLGENLCVSKATLLEIVSDQMKKFKSVTFEEVTEGELSDVLSGVLAELSSRGEKASLQESFSKAFETAIRKERKTDFLSEQAVMTAVEVAMQSLVSSGETINVSKGTITSIALDEIVKVKSAELAKITESAWIAAVGSGILEELSQKGEKASVLETFSKAFELAILEEREVSTPSDEAVKLAVESALRAVTSSGEKLNVPNVSVLSIATEELNKMKSTMLEKATEAKVIESVSSAVLKELSSRGEKASVQESFIEAFESAICSERKGVTLNEEAIKSAVERAIETLVSSGEKINVPKATLRSIATAEIHKIESAAPEGVTEGRVIAAVCSAIVEELSSKGEKDSVKESFSKAFEAAIGKEQKAKAISEKVVKSAVESAIKVVVSSGEKINMSKAEILSVASEVIQKIKSATPEGITESNIMAAVNSAVLQELSSRGEKPIVQECFLNAFKSAVDSEQISERENLLPEEEILTTIDYAINTELSRYPKSTISGQSLMESINVAISKKKSNMRMSILTEDVLLECMKNAIQMELADHSEGIELSESLLMGVSAAMEEVRHTHQPVSLTKENVMVALNSMMNSDFIRDKNIKLSKEAIILTIDNAFENELLVNKEHELIEEKLMQIVESAVAEKTTSEETEILMEAFHSAIEAEKSEIRLKPITEKVFMDIARSVLEKELSNSEMSKKLLDSINSNIENEISKFGTLLTEEMLLATAYSEIEQEVLKAGECFAELLLSGIDSTVESERARRRIASEEIILEAVNSIADEFMLSPERKSSMIAAVVSTIKTENLVHKETGKPILDTVMKVVEDQLSNLQTFDKTQFMSALSAAITAEQSVKRGALLTKEFLSAAVTSAIEDQSCNSPPLLEIKKDLLVAADSAIESEFAYGADRRLTEKSLLSSIYFSVENALGELSGTGCLEGVVESMQKYLSENLDEVIVGTVNYMVANETVMDKLRYAVNNSSNSIQVIEKLSSVLNDNMGEAFQKLSLGDPSLLKSVVEMLNVDKLSSTEQATEALQQAIVGAVRQRSAETLRSMMEKSCVDGPDLKELLLQSVGLAKALGMNHVASMLLNVVSDSTSHEVLAGDDTVIDILQRLTIMRQFAETKPELASALRQLITDPELAKRNPSIRELVRHSTALMTVPEEVLHSSADIPASLLMSDNSLAMEQFLARAKRPRTLLILKSGIQAVVPKESARAVLTGQVGDLYSVEKDFTADDENSFSLQRGDLVEVVNFGSSSEKRLRLDIDGESTNILDNSAAKHKLSVRPKRRYTDSRQRGTSPFSQETRWLVRTVEGTTQEGWIPSKFLKLKDNYSCKTESKSDNEFQREGVVKELVETEEEFVRDLQHVVEKYMKPLEKPTVPRIVRDNVDLIFSNFRQIANFHNTVLIEGVKYYANEPQMLGKTFLRLERDFDKHVAYCRDEIAAQEFLAENLEAKDFFEELSQTIGDDKNLSEHLKLPIQRINDYQLLLKELVKYSSALGESTKDLEKALELMLAIPHRANDNKFLNNIEGFHGSIHKLGRLIRHDWFTITHKDNKSKERYLFLFKEHILICKVKKISEDRSVFVLKDIIQLPEVQLIDEPELESFKVHNKNDDEYPVTICGHTEGVKENWLKEINKYAPYVFVVDKSTLEDIENSNFYDAKEYFEREPLSPTGSIENQEAKQSKNQESNIVGSDNETHLNRAESESRRLEKNSEVNSVQKENHVEIIEPLVENTDNDMSRRTSRIVEESYSVSSQREQVYVQSSRSQYSSSSYSSSSARVSSSNYRSSSISDSSTARLAIQSVGKPTFVRTIKGLSLEPGETAAFECQLDSEAQITWLKDNKVLEDRLADRVVKSSTDDHIHRLELQHLSEYDSGIYTALAQNSEGSSTCTAQLQVQQISDEEKRKRAQANAPLFTVRLKDTELLRNTNFRFMVKVRGDPMPEVKFLKDGVPVRTDGGRVILVDEKADIGFYELVISDVQNEDSGKYSCIATNNYGEALCEGTVTVTDDKKVFDGLEETNLLEPGEKPTFSWIKDGKPFDPEERFKVLLGNEEDSLALVFQRVRPEDAGLYTCVASTSTGRISCSAELSVQGTVSQLPREPKKPKLSSELRETQVNVGGTAMLKTKILGFPKPKVKWFHDGHEIKAAGRFKFLFEDDDSMTLVIKNVVPEDAGIYKLVASNELGEDGTELRLSVKAGPKFNKNLEDITVKAEETIKVITEVEGSPFPQIKWYKDGVEIKESDRIKIESKDQTCTLIIEKSSDTDSGSYSVVASNEVNECSQSLKIKVSTSPKVLQDLESKIEVSEGEKLVLRVRVAADPSPTVCWMKDGKEIKADGKRIKIQQDGDTYILEISDAQRDDAAKYSAQITNEHGVTTSESEVEVKSAPFFKERMKNITAKDGETDVEFSVKVNAFPKPKIKWYLGETEITEKRSEYKKKEEGENYKLIIKKMSTELKGKYTCKVINDCGEAECSADLTVNCKPKFSKCLQPKIQVDEGAELTLQVECSGSPEPEVKWLKDGKEIFADAHIKITRDSHRSESYSLTLNLVKKEDAGEYEVKATNSEGSVSTKSHVEVTAKDTLYTEEHVLTVEDENPEDLGVIEGKEESHSVFEKKKTTVEFTENEWAGVKIEEVESYRLEEKPSSAWPFGLVEEYSESEVKAHNLSVNRGISIVSLSEDERTISRNNSGNEMDSGNDSNDDVAKDKLDMETVNGKDEIEDIWPAEDDDYVHIMAKKENLKRLKQDEVKKGLDKNDLDTPKGIDKDEAFNKLNMDGLKPSEAEKATVKSDLDTPKGVEKDEAFNKLNVDSLKPADAEKVSVKSDLDQFKQIEVEEAPVKIEPVDLEQAGEEDKSGKGDLVQSKVTGVEEASLKRNLKGTEESEVEETLVKTDLKADDVDNETDPVVENLLKRIKQQRSVLEDILNKENQSTSEEGPKILSHNLEDRTMIESSTIVYEVKVSGVPKPTVKWFKDGKEISSSNNVKLSEDGDTFKLELIDLRKTDSGLYSITVVNDFGEKSQEAKLQVESDALNKKPIIKTPLSDKKVAKKEEAVFKCILVAESEPKITWYHDEQEVESKDVTTKVDVKKIDNNMVECTCTMKIAETQASHSGKYKIKAENKYGYDESSAELTLIFKPEIENLKDVTAIPQEDAEFEAKVHYSTDVKWLDKTGKIIKGNDRIVLTEDKSNEIYKLKIISVKNEDAAEYVLVAKNDVGETKQKAYLHVQAEAPTIVKPLEDVKANDYSDVDFHVRFNGFPKPQVKWFKDGVELTSSDRIIIKTLDEGQVSSMLTIKHIQKEDVAEYTVVGSNVAGSAESKCVLKMSQLPPVIGKGFPRSEDVSEGEPLELKCKVDGSPVPKVKWLKNGEPLNADDHVQIFAQPDGTVRLSIDNAKPEDSGAYEMIAENPNGTATAICAVSVKAKPRKPEITKGLECVKGVEGEPLKLIAKVEGFPAPEVKWFKDGHPLRPSQGIATIDEPDGTVGLAFDCVKPDDAGKYSVKIANKAGEIEDEAKVEVQPKEKRPMFESHLMPVSTIEGYPVKLEVKAVGHPKPLIKWTHNGEEIVPDGQRIKVIEQPDGKTALLLDKATLDDGGEYAAIASNEKGEVASEAELKVTGRELDGALQEKPSFLSPLKDVDVNEGSPLLLSATFVGNPLPDAVWTKDDIPIKPDDRTLMTCDGRKVTLEVKPSSCPDSGVYSCRLSNPLGEDSCKAKANVKKVYEPPEFTKKLTDLQQLPNCDAKFTGRVSGMPKPDVEWFFNGKPIKENDKYHMKTDGDTVCLYVRNCTPEDAGRYRCRAYNRTGEATSEANLDIVPEISKQPRAEPPSFLKKIGDCDVYKGMAAKFTACATGYPEPEFEWFRDSIKLYENRRVKIEDGGNGLLRLTIANVDIGDVGKYRLRIFNPHGEAFCDADLRFESLEPRNKKGLADQYDHYKKIQDTGIPVPLADPPIISRMTDRHLTLSWKPSIPHGPREPVTYRVEMAEQPDGDWFTARTGVRSCACEIRNLVPFRDYKFRIRVENKYGISDPSPFAVTYRQRLEPELPKFVPHLGPGIDFRPESSPYFPKDFDIERPPHDGYKQAPQFLRQEHDTQYGIKNENSNLFWFVYGYPKPTMTYYFNDEPIEMGGRYDCSYTRNGQATLFINKMLERDVGIYEAVAKNEHGEARQRVRLELAEYPKFIQRPEETVIMLRDSGKLTARIVGVPYPEIKWYKDWQPLAPSSRIRFQKIEPDTVVLIMNDVILKDEGLYSVSARNVAGAVSASAMVHIEENAQNYSYVTYGRGRNVKPKTKPMSEYYDLGDELGRGTQGVTYHAVERQTGHNFAAKVMHGRADLKAFMLNELDIMNCLNHKKLIRLHDSFEAMDLLILVMELAGGGELLDCLTRRTYITEVEIAGYIRQILWGLEYMHSQGIAHLSLTLGDLLISHPGGDDLKICDFGLSRKILYGKPTALYYGMPEYVSPEIVNGDAVGYAADMWALGIITYILLSGYSPFKGLNDRETLTNIKEGKWEFKEEWFTNISSEARDFIMKLLMYEPLKRMDVNTALKHPWLNLADRTDEDQYKIKTDNLKSYYSELKDWYKNANCRTWYRRKPLSGAFTHPSKMVYPPGDVYTPEPEIPKKEIKEPKQPRTWEENIPTREPLGYEIGMIKSESHYQNGPDTYLLQLRDVDLPCRLRHYLKVAANLETGSPLDVVDKHIDWRTPVIRERRRFTDVMDEEIDDERKERINKYGSADVYSIRRLKHELGLRSDGHAEAEAMLEYQRDGHLPIFREKPQFLAITEDQPAELSCFAVGEPKPLVQWFKNDIVISESNRIKMVEDEDGRSYLKFLPALQVDVGIYKVVARNRIGQTTARARIVVAGVPSSPDSPEATEISATEILLKWKQPKDDGLSPVMCYSLQYKEAASVEWLTIANNIDHEFWLVKNLKPDTGYVFRLSARNVIGWSEKGIPTKTVRTKETGAPDIEISRAMRHLQSQTEAGGEVCPEETIEKLNYSIENEPIEWSSDSGFNEKYSFVSEITRGQYSLIAKGIEKSSNRSIVAKVMEMKPETEEITKREYENFRSLRHERIVNLLAALRPTPNIAVFVMEKLQGADILTYFTCRHEYNEQMVVTVIIQILDALQYLHWRGYCHLDIQPDNVVLSRSARSLQVKLVDFGNARNVSKLGTTIDVPPTDYTAPEVLCGEPAFPQTDIWSLGTLTYVLLSGVSPFRGVNQEETRQNISFVRYRFEYLHKELTQEATRFLMLIFKRTPSKRPTVEECYEHRWLLPTEYMIKKRERAVFLGNRLKDYCDLYHKEKAEKASCAEGLGRAFGDRILTRSNSIQEELTTA